MLASGRGIPPFSGQFRTADSTPRDAFFPIRTSYSTTSPSRLFRSTSALYAQVMLTKAIQQHQPAPAAKPHSLSQTLFPASSPVSRPNLHSNGSRHKQPQLSGSPISKTNTVLKPSASSVLNGPGIARTIRSNKLAKRTLSQMTDMGSVFSSNDSFRDSSRPDPFSKPPSQLSGSAHVTSLHDAVYFDENDFDDDADLDLEVEDPMDKGYLSVTKGDLYLPVEQRTPSINTSGTTTSTATLEWSSSPLQHKATPPNAGLLRRTNDAYAADVAELRTTVVVDPDPNPRPSKRRTIPWRAEDDNDAIGGAKNGPPAHVQKIIDGHRANKVQLQQGNGEFTPLPKDDYQFQYSWNKTASAIKEEQKQLRQANKRLVKSNEDMEEATRAKKRQKLESIFLSEEQQRVLKLVVESGKSVFFTGSAGTF